MSQDNTHLYRRTMWGVRHDDLIVAGFLTKGDAIKWKEDYIRQAGEDHAKGVKLCYLEPFKERDKGHS